MRMEIVTLLFVGLLFVGTVRSQKELLPPDCPCPASEIKVSAWRIREGETATFTLKFPERRPPQRCKFSYLWESSDGQIIRGQGTKRATVKATVGTGGKTITVVAGMNDGSRDCHYPPSATIEIMKP